MRGRFNRLFSGYRRQPIGAISIFRRVSYAAPSFGKTFLLSHPWINRVFPPPTITAIFVSIEQAPASLPDRTVHSNVNRLEERTSSLRKERRSFTRNPFLSDLLQLPLSLSLSISGLERYRDV